MNDQQFALQQEMLQMILDKLEEIRCGIIDVETELAEKVERVATRETVVIDKD